MARPAANPGAPKEAIDWFRRRIPITKDEWLDLDELAQEKAFTIAGVAQLDLIAQVQAMLVRALEKGEALEGFKARAAASLEKAWGEERPWRLSTIFRNASQRAYQAGRREQLQEPDVLELRPFLKAEPIFDAATTDICRALKGVVLPADHSFWTHTWPPLHHNCRTAIRSLTAAQAAREGVSSKAPSAKPDKGFGSVDPLEWEPDLGEYPSELVKIFRRGQ